MYGYFSVFNFLFNSEKLKNQLSLRPKNLLYSMKNFKFFTTNFIVTETSSKLKFNFRKLEFTLLDSFSNHYEISVKLIASSLFSGHVKLQPRKRCVLPHELRVQGGALVDPQTSRRRITARHCPAQNEDPGMQIWSS